MKTQEQRRRDCEYQKRYRERHGDRLRLIVNERQRRWREEHRDEYNARRKLYPSYGNKRHARKRDGRHRAKQNDYLRLVKEHYGCTNPACGWSGPLHWMAIDFHHIDATTKTKGVAYRGFGWERMREEMNKCCCLCAVCHRLVELAGLDASGFRRCKIEIKDGSILPD